MLGQDETTERLFKAVDRLANQVHTLAVKHNHLQRQLVRLQHLQQQQQVQQNQQQQQNQQLHHQHRHYMYNHSYYFPSPSIIEMPALIESPFVFPDPSGGVNQSVNRQSSPKRVVIFDNDAVCREVLVRLLNHLMIAPPNDGKLIIHVAGSGEETKMAHQRSPFDIIFLDAQEHNVLSTIRQFDKNTPVVMMTPRNALDTCTDNITNGQPDECLRKPFTSDELAVLLKKYNLTR